MSTLFVDKPTDGAGGPRRRYLRLPPSLLLAWAVVVVAALWALAPGLFTGYSAVEGIAGAHRLAPGGEHWLGTDQLGRDLYARMVYGAAQTLSGALGGAADALMMRIVDVLLAIPGLLLALSVIILLGFGTVNAAIAVGITSVANFARLARVEVVRVRRSDYVEAAYGSGGTFRAVLWRHILPNSLTSVLAFSALQFGNAILAIATLSFLGYGAPPPTPEWGLLIAEGRNYLATAWWLTTFPGLAVIAVVLAANRIGRTNGGRPL